jgi:hypothetical protein
MRRRSVYCEGSILRAPCVEIIVSAGGSHDILTRELDVAAPVAVAFDRYQPPTDHREPERGILGARNTTAQKVPLTPMQLLPHVRSGPMAIDLPECE